MFSAILILLSMPIIDLSNLRGIQFRPFSKIAFFFFVINFLILMLLGAKHVESPFIELGQICTILYFFHFLMLIPLISLSENTLFNMGSKKINPELKLKKKTFGRMFTPLKKIFSRANVTKLLIIFLAGLSSRYFVNYFFGINVFSDYTNFISLLYYFLFSTFVVVVQVLVDLKPISLSSGGLPGIFNTGGSNGGVGPNNSGPLNQPNSTTNVDQQRRNH